MRYALLLWMVAGVSVRAQSPTDLFNRGEGISLEGVIPANERGILSLTGYGRHLVGGTTGRAAHLFMHDLESGKTQSLLRLPGGIGLIVIKVDGGDLVGTQADPTGTAAQTDPKAVGQLYRVRWDGKKLEKKDLGVAVEGQGIYSLAYLPKSKQVVGNTWPDGHFFSLNLNTGKVKDHGAIAGHRTFETPYYQQRINQTDGRKVRYPRQVSRVIAVVREKEAYTGGAGGFLYRYDAQTGELKKTAMKLPSAPGRESWASLDALSGEPYSGGGTMGGPIPPLFLGGTSDGYLFAARTTVERVRMQELGKPSWQQGIRLESLGKPFAAPGITGLVLSEKRSAGNIQSRVFHCLSGRPTGLSRAFTYTSSSVQEDGFQLGGIPSVDGQLSMEGFQGLHAVEGAILTGESDRIARLVRFPLDDKKQPIKRKPPRESKVEGGPQLKEPKEIDGHVVFAPKDTTTEASAYTALEVGKDGQVYVGSARYGDYAWLLRFDPAKKPLWMDKVVGLRELTGERREGINTQGKIHAKIVVGADGKIWFASKQAHEVFDTRPEYEDADGYPGGHLCWFDPKTGFSRSVGILKRQEGLMAGAIDDARGKLYYRSEPRNHFLVYDIKTGAVRDRGNLGAIGRYMAMDEKGCVYLVGRGQTLCRYNPETDYVDELAIEVQGPGDYSAPYVLHRGPNGKLYGIGTQHPWVMEFDIVKATSGDFPKVTMRNVAPTAPAGMPTLDIHSAVFGKDGRLYYPLVTSFADPKKRAERFLILMRFDPASGKTEVVGKPRIVGLDEEKVKHAYVRGGDRYVFDHTQGAAVGPDGTLYIMDIYPQLNVVCFPRLTAPR